MRVFSKILFNIGWGIFSLGLVFLFIGAFLAGQYNQDMINAPALIDIGVLEEMPTSPMGLVSFLVTIAGILGFIGAFIVMTRNIVITGLQMFFDIILIGFNAIKKYYNFVLNNIFHISEKRMRRI